MVLRIYDVPHPFARALPALSLVSFISLDNSCQTGVRWTSQCLQNDQPPSPDRVFGAAEPRSKFTAREWLIRYHVADDLKDKVVAVKAAKRGAGQPRIGPRARNAPKPVNTGSRHPPLLSGSRATRRAFKSRSHSRFDFRQRSAPLAECRRDREHILDLMRAQ